MARVKGALATRKRRKKILKLAKGLLGFKSRHFKMAKQAVMKSAIMPISAESRRRETSAACGSLESTRPAAQTARPIPRS